MEILDDRSLLYAEKAPGWEAHDHPYWDFGTWIPQRELRGPGRNDIKYRHSRNESPPHIKAAATENEDTVHGDTYGVHQIYPGTRRGGVWKSV